MKKVKRAQAQKIFLVDLLSKKKDRQRRYENAKLVLDETAAVNR